jgi:hypothetical protein
MRHAGLVFAAGVVTTLLCCRVFGPLPASTIAASPPPWLDKSLERMPFPPEETRLQKLQHYQVACQLLDMEEGKRGKLEQGRQHQVDKLSDFMFAEGLDKEPRATWERMHDDYQYSAWASSTRKLPATEAAALFEREEKTRDELRDKKQAYLANLNEGRGPAAKAFQMRFQTLAWSRNLDKQIRLIEMLTKERDKAQSALSPSGESVPTKP